MENFGTRDDLPYSMGTKVVVKVADNHIGGEAKVGFVHGVVNEFGALSYSVQYTSGECTRVLPSSIVFATHP